MKSTVLFRSNWYFHYRLWRIPIPFYNEYNKGNLGCTWYKYSFIWYSWISTQSLKTTCITICKNKILEKKLKVIKSSDIAFIAIFLSNFLSLHTAEKSTYIRGADVLPLKSDFSVYKCITNFKRLISTNTCHLHNSCTYKKLINSHNFLLQLKTFSWKIYINKLK